MKITSLLFVFLFISSIITMAQNNPPQAVDDYATTVSGGTTSYINVIFNDTDPDGNLLYYDTIVGPPKHGSVFVIYTSNVGLVKYTADSSYYGYDTVRYRVCDYGIPELCDTGNMIINVSYVFYPDHKTLDANNVRAGFNADGTLFSLANNDGGQFEAPIDSVKTTIYAGNLWIGGIDGGNNLRIAAQEYAVFGMDFWPGPLDTTGAVDIDTVEAEKWNRIWKINKSDVDDLIIDFNDNGSIDNPIPQDIIEWPAHGDTSKGQSYKLAPFFDNNSDGKYDPYDGDYPVIKGDQMLWWVINDEKTHEGSGGNPIGVEMQISAYAFNCPGDSALYNTVFLNYKIINRGTFTLDSTYVGVWTDTDIGCYNDDYIGSDVERGTYFGYNGDNFDEDCSGIQGYGSQIPAQAVTILAGPYQDNDGFDNPLTSDVATAIAQNGIPYDGLGFGYGDGIIDNERLGMRKFISYNRPPFGQPATQNPATPDEFYNYLRGFWKDGSSITIDSCGYGGVTKTDYIYPDNSDPLGWGTNGFPQSPWSENTCGKLPGDRMGIASMGPFTLTPGAVHTIDLAYVFARAKTGGVQASIDLMKQRIDEIRNAFKNGTLTACGGAIGIDEHIKEQNIMVSLHPNPMTDIAVLKFRNPENEIFTLTLYDVTGKQLRFIAGITGGEVKIERKGLNSGMYFYMLYAATGKTANGKMIVQ